MARRNNRYTAVRVVYTRMVRAENGQEAVQAWSLGNCQDRATSRGEAGDGQRTDWDWLAQAGDSRGASGVDGLVSRNRVGPGRWDREVIAAWLGKTSQFGGVVRD
jgi:hypothetical protein